MWRVACPALLLAPAPALPLQSPPMEGPNGAREFVEQLRSELPRLLREDVEVRGQVIGLLSDYLTTRQETAAILAELRQMRADFDRRMDEQGRRIEEQGRRIEEQGRRIAEHTQALAALQRQVMGLGARWGLMTEDAFRRSVGALFADQPEVHVEHWRHHDAAGTVFGYPTDVDMDVVVRNGTLLLIEIKSSISGADVTEFSRRATLYQEVTGRQPNRLLMIGPYVDVRAREVAERLGIEVVTSVTPPAI